MRKPRAFDETYASEELAIDDQLKSCGKKRAANNERITALEDKQRA